MSTSVAHEAAAHPQLIRMTLAAALLLALAGCGAVGELTRTWTWAWIAGVVVVLAVVGCFASRMRR